MRIKGIIENIRNNDHVRADNLLYFAVRQFVRKFRVLRRKCEKAESHGKGYTWVLWKSRLVQICFLGTSFGLLAHDDLLLCRNLLVFCPYILVLKKNRNAVVFYLIFSSSKNREKKNTRKSQGRSRRYFIAHSNDKRTWKRRNSVNTDVRAYFSFCNNNAPANFGPQSILWMWNIRCQIREFSTSLKIHMRLCTYYLLSKLCKQTLYCRQIYLIRRSIAVNAWCTNNWNSHLFIAID